MNTNDQINKHANENRLWTGIFLVLGGLVYLAYKMGAPFPAWLLTWPVGLIAAGIFVGIKNRFNNISWIIMIAIGGLFLVDDVMPDIDLHNYIGPIVLIAVGVIFILRPKRQNPSTYRRDRWGTDFRSHVSSVSDDSEYINDNTFLGSMNKVIISKNFKGGEVNCVLGGAQIDLTQADIQGQAVLEINQVFGGTKLIVPANWNLKIEMTAVLGGVEDKRTAQSSGVDSGKVLVIKGTAVFGGVEIKNY